MSKVPAVDTTGAFPRLPRTRRLYLVRHLTARGQVLSEVFLSRAPAERAARRIASRGGTAAVHQARAEWMLLHYTTPEDG